MFSFRPSGCEERPVGQPGALQPAAGVRQHVRQLVWLHASGPLPVSPGPRALQGPSVRPAQEVQRPGEGLKKKKKTVARNVQKLPEKQRRRADRPALWTAKMDQSLAGEDSGTVWDVGNVPVEAVCHTDNHQTDPRV